MSVIPFEMCSISFLVVPTSSLPLIPSITVILCGLLTDTSLFSRWSISALFSPFLQSRVPQQAAMTRARVTPVGPPRCTHAQAHKLSLSFLCVLDSDLFFAYLWVLSPAHAALSDFHYNQFPSLSLHSRAIERKVIFFPRRQLSLFEVKVSFTFSKVFVFSSNVGVLSPHQFITARQSRLL